MQRGGGGKSLQGRGHEPGTPGAPSCWKTQGGTPPLPGGDWREGEFQTSGLLNCGRTHFHCFKASGAWQLVPTAPGH